jgi:signal-transduction protein with cAMP-binding, CBS, and nucleotidyltransferase domain
MIKVSPNTILFKEGDTGDYFYIIKKGTIEITSSKEKTKKYLKEGDTFGELALLERKKRTATVKSVDFVILYELNGKIFRDIVTTINQHELKDRLEFIALVPIFESMENVQLNTIASSMNKYTFDAGTKIIDEGEVGDCL